MTRLWTIRPLSFGEFPALEKSKFTYDRNAGQKIVAPCLGWLLQSGDEAILVDTGPSAPEVAADWHSPIARTPEQVPDAALRAVGVPPEKLKLVILSHLHWDHCYNLECFPEARFLVQADELRAAVDPIPTQRAIYEVGLPGLLPPWMAVFDRLELLRGDVEVAPGISVVVLPGHTPGLQGVVVETAAGRYLLPSDAVPLVENLGLDGKGVVPPGLHIDVAACLRSMERMRTVADVILPSHDVKVLQNLIYPPL
jgi:N-acyl homoserine lactone hydrolase